MATLKDDLLTVAKTAWAISCDDHVYDPETRGTALELWSIALELLQSHERRRSFRLDRASAGLRL